MGNDFNQVAIVGRLVKDAELRYTPNGKSVTSFTIASNESFTRQDGSKVDSVSFIPCVAWGKLGEVVSQYCKKGSKVLVGGRIKQRSYDGQDGVKKYVTEIISDTVQFLDTKQNGDAGGNAPAPSDDSYHGDNEVPF